MPWTFAHPAAVLPLRRLTGEGRLSFAVLVVGSMSPDFDARTNLFRLLVLEIIHATTAFLLFLSCAALWFNKQHGDA
ncbi:DUF4184 family protein [Variovorax rhizosphaerae]|uniref:DUF4184 family protein n=1 Tax=Variovorax rhizosphaerae TaxID=1836200 RepID=A0ABU8WF14_9BURK